MIDPNASLQEVRDIFSHDRFATATCGCQVMEAAPGHAVCELEVTPEHLNEKGGVMGGAIFTVADLAMAVATNVGHEATVSVSFSIDFMSPCRGKRLIATADVIKDGRSLVFCEASVTDELGNKVARVSGSSMHLQPRA